MASASKQKKGKGNILYFMEEKQLAFKNSKNGFEKIEERKSKR